jgi:rhodanese-related sulfurtransferase
MKKEGSINAVKLLIILGVVASTILTISFSTAAREEIPRINIKELKNMMDQEAEVIIIDVQPKAVYDKGHIKGAVSIPWKSQLLLEDVWSIPGGIPIVIYCACGPGESDSADIAKQLNKMGYSDVMVLEHPAIEGWKDAGYPIEK